ncbi:MAG: putative transposase [Gammaproteobacteria bacterium]|jgi:putative transposase
MLHALHPDTVVRWHREGFSRYWTRKSRRVGRPVIAGELRALIGTIQAENLTWGHRESMENVSNSDLIYLKLRSASDRADNIAGVDLFTVLTVTFRILYVFIVPEPARRHIVHFNVTEHLSAMGGTTTYRGVSLSIPHRVV